MHVNDNIKLIRELSGLTQAQFAKLIKTNLSNLKTYENTNVKPKAFVLFNISLCTNVSIEDLERKRLKASDIKFDRNWMEEEKLGEAVEKVETIRADENSTTPHDRLYHVIEARRRDFEKWAELARADKERAEKEKDRLLDVIDNNLALLIKIVGDIHASSKDMADDVSALTTEVQAEHRAMMDTLDKAARQTIGTTRAAARTVELASHEALAKKGRRAGVGK
jgi:transcriptional regulator with XRE-family HTH domain